MGIDRRTFGIGLAAAAVTGGTERVNAELFGKDRADFRRWLDNAFATPEIANFLKLFSEKQNNHLRRAIEGVVFEKRNDPRYKEDSFRVIQGLEFVSAVLLKLQTEMFPKDVPTSPREFEGLLVSAREILQLLKKQPPGEPA